MSLLTHGLIAALGIFFIIVGVVVPHIIDWKVKDSIRAAMTIDGPNDDGYEKWVNGKTSVTTRKCIPMELTNPTEFLAGAAPNIVMRTDLESWFVSTKQLISTNWSADLRSVRVASFQQSFVHANTPSSPDRPFLTLNFAYYYMVKRAGSESNLKISFAAGMMGKLVQTGGITAFRTAPTFCLVGGICGMAAYAAATSNSVPSMTDTTAGMMVGMLAPNAAIYGGYMYNVSVISQLPAGSAKTAMIAYMDANYPFFASHDPSVSTDSILLVQYLNWLQTSTFTTLVGGFSSAPAYGLKFANTTCRKLFFSPDPLANFLTGSTASLFKNMTSHSQAELNTILTGWRDDAKLGMDYYTEVNSKTMVEGQSVTPYSVEGRQSSYTPFIDRPDRFTIFFASFMRHVDCVFAGGSRTLKGIPVHNFVVDSAKLTSVSTEYYNPFEGFLNMTGVSSGIPIFFSPPRFAGTNLSHFPARITGLGAPRGDEGSVVLVEGTTGQAIYASAKLQLNVYAQFSANLFSISDVNQTQDYMFPIVAGDDQKEISDDSAKSLKSAVVTVPLAMAIIFYIFVILGCLLVLGAVGTWIYLAYCSGDAAAGGDAKDGGETAVGAEANGSKNGHHTESPAEMHIKTQQDEGIVNPLFGGVRVTATEDN